MSSSKIRCFAALSRNVARKPGPPYQDHLAMLEIGVHVEQDHEPVVEPFPPDSPLIHQGPRVAVSLLGGSAVLDDLGVDRDLRPGPCLDRVDLGLDSGDRGRSENAGAVVDRNPVDRSRERRAGVGARDGGRNAAAAGDGAAPERRRRDPANADEEGIVEVARGGQRLDVAADDRRGTVGAEDRFLERVVGGEVDSGGAAIGRDPEVREKPT